MKIKSHPDDTNTLMKSRCPPGFDQHDVEPPPLAGWKGKIRALALDLAGKCNLGCRYCAERSTQPPRTAMTEEVMEAAWSFLFPGGQSSGGASIRLGSGKPLLAFPLMMRLSELIAGHDKKHSTGPPAVFLTTNGTLIDSNIADWLAASGWHVKISLDGPGDVHDAWRVTPDGQGTFEQVSTAAAVLAQRIPELLSVTAVLCRGADPKHVFDAIAGLGVRRIELVPVAHHDQAVRPGNEEIRQYEAFVDEYARHYEEGGSNLPTLVRFARCVTRAMGYSVSRVSCGAGRPFLGVGPAGDIYPCFRFIGIESYRLGSLSSGLDNRAVLAFGDGPGRPYEQRTACNTCWAAPLCGGPCFACAELFGPGNGQPLEYQCAYSLADARAAVWLVNRLKTRNPGRLLSFLPGAVEVSEI